MFLDHLQTRLAGLYEVEAPCDIERFLITDINTLRDLQDPDRRRDTPEQLLVCQDHEAAYVSLYLDQSILATLKQTNPEEALNEENLNAYCIAVEGVSHFLYLTWRITHQRPVTQLEMELQAEIDKYISISLLFAQQAQANSPTPHELLFEAISLQPGLMPDESDRYLLANRYAAKYCNTFKQQLHSSNLRETGLQQPLINELRRFYRLTQNEKLWRIDTLH
jgi:hypothetical protein